MENNLEVGGNTDSIQILDDYLCIRTALCAAVSTVFPFSDSVSKWAHLYLCIYAATQGICQELAMSHICSASPH